MRAESIVGFGSMVGFGPKQAWLAIRDREPDAVITALGLRDLGAVSWHQGVDLAYVTDDRVAVTPRMIGANGRGWVLVPGRWWLRSDDGPEVAALSDQLHTEVQFFSTYRVTEHHRWERAVDGVLVRAFDYLGQAGEIRRWWGDPDEHERAIGLPEAEPSHEDEDEDDGLNVLIDESSVMRLAAAWSVDPTSLGGLPAPGPLRSASAEA